VLIVFIIFGAILGAVTLGGGEFSLLGGLLGFILGKMSEQNNLLAILKEEIGKLQHQVDSLKVKNISLDNRIKKGLKLDGIEQPETENRHQNKLSINNSKDTQPAKLEAAKTNVKSDWELSLDSSLDTPEVGQVEVSSSNATASNMLANNRSDSASSIPPLINKQAEYHQRNVRPTAPSIVDKLITRVTAYFTEGNIVVRVGAVILFFGVAFLLKYAAENSIVPIEMRLISVLVGGIALLVFGWKFKDRNQGYGLVLQGAAIGILYLTLFASFRLYQLVPSGLAFPLLILFSGLAMALAVLQNSLALAFLSVAGGFLAPVLTSTGSGSHVALFSYYLVLNLGIFAVAWFKAWRLLNLTGFVFTFLIGTAWGVTKYEASDFATTEPFLISFFLLYISVAILFANKFKSNIKGYVDSTLVFGLPVVAFALQVGLVMDLEFGLAWSAFTLGAFYLTTAYILVKRFDKQLHVLAEAFVALGIIFTSLVIPFALDGEWTAAAWSIEGAGLVWVGLRQERWFPKYFGTLIQLVGGVIFLAEIDLFTHSSFSLDAQLLGILFVSVAALFTSFQIWRKREDLTAIEAIARVPYLLWGLGWWYLGGFFEILQVTNTQVELASILVFISLSGLIWHVLETKLSWQPMTNLVWLTLPLLIVSGVTFFDSYQHLFASWNALLWLFAIIAFYSIIYRQDKMSANCFMPERVASSALHVTSLLLIMLVSLLELDWLLGHFELLATSWTVALYGLLACLWLLALIKVQKWPTIQFVNAYRLIGLSVVMIALVIWSLFINFSHDGNPHPLPYIPLLNPLDIIQMLAFISIYRAIGYQQINGLTYSESLIKRAAIAFVFIWLNVILFRCIHSWTGVVYNSSALFDSSIVQTSISISWTILGLTGTIFGTRRESRKLWLYAAGLIGVVVAKLFIIDLSNSSSIERIISFVVVGLLLLIVGYFSPLPPKERAEEKTAEKKDDDINEASESAG